MRLRDQLSNETSDSRRPELVGALAIALPELHLVGVGEISISKVEAKT